MTSPSLSRVGCRVHEATVIADEQIAYWQRLGWSARRAWVALELPWAWGVEWWEVRAWMVRWLLTQNAPVVPINLRRAA